MRIGIHCSTSGALVNAAKKAVELGASCFQIFTASPRMWRASMPGAAEIGELKAYRAEHGLAPLVVHDSYLINLASPDGDIRAKSVAAMRGEMERAAAIGAEYLVMHPGSAKDGTVKEGIESIARSLVEASKGLKAGGLTLLFENTAGAGATIGRSFEELRELRNRVDGRIPMATGYCLDTCHLYASGFDVASAGGLERTLADVERVLGLAHVPVVHVNDSKGELGSRLDRHANIGEGHIGLAGFRRILNHPLLGEKAFVLETPIDEPGDDQRNVDALKRLCRKPRTTTKRSS
jgi:deoxyribonuclease-4